MARIAQTLQSTQKPEATALRLGATDHNELETRRLRGEEDQGSLEIRHAFHTAAGTREGANQAAQPIRGRIHAKDMEVGRAGEVVVGGGFQAI